MNVARFPCAPVAWTVTKAQRRTRRDAKRMLKTPERPGDNSLGRARSPADDRADEDPLARVEAEPAHDQRRAVDDEHARLRLRICSGRDGGARECDEDEDCEPGECAHDEGSMPALASTHS